MTTLGPGRRVVTCAPSVAPATLRPAEGKARAVDSRELFAGHRELCIAHAGEIYRLRITRLNKLILTK